MTTLLDTFRARGLIEAVSSDDLGTRLAEGNTPFYTGFDPTAPSLQIGNLFAIITMRRLQLAGHKPYALVGGATGMIGDPSGKSVERNLLDDDTLAANIAGQRRQLESLLDFEPGVAGAELVNNRDWLGEMRFLDFLRDVGRFFRMGEMLAKDSVKSRLQSDVGLSFTEFSYQMLQAYDFMHLHKTRGICLQIGGGDQWGNITAGIDYTRKTCNAQVFGFVIPLVTDSTGKKFGKSEGGTVYLDPAMTSPYQMYQYLLNSDDSCVIRYLKYFTFLEMEAIAALEARMQSAPEARDAQRALARAVTEMVHGAEGLRAAEMSTAFLFGGKEAEAYGEALDMDVIQSSLGVPMVRVGAEELAAGIPLADLLVRTPLFTSKGEVRRMVQQGGVYLNGTVMPAFDTPVTVADLRGGGMLLRKGKKTYCLVRV